MIKPSIHWAGISFLHSDLSEECRIVTTVLVSALMAYAVMLSGPAALIFFNVALAFLTSA
jgi:hypothetical protein